MFNHPAPSTPAHPLDLISCSGDQLRLSRWAAERHAMLQSVREGRATRRSGPGRGRLLVRRVLLLRTRSGTGQGTSTA